MTRLEITRLSKRVHALEGQSSAQAASATAMAAELNALAQRTAEVAKLAAGGRGADGGAPVGEEAFFEAMARVFFFCAPCNVLSYYICA